MTPVFGTEKIEKLIDRINKLETMDNIRQLRPLIMV